MAHFNVKTLHSYRTAQKLPYPRALQPFWAIYSQDRGNVRQWKCSPYTFFLLLVREHTLMAHFNLVPADIIKNYGVHPVPSGK